MINKRDKKTGRIAPKVAKDDIPRINRMIKSGIKEEMTNKQLAGMLMQELDCNIHLANALVKNYLLTEGK